MIQYDIYMFTYHMYLYSIPITSTVNPDWGWFWTHFLLVTLQEGNMNMEVYNQMMVLIREKLLVPEIEDGNNTFMKSPRWFYYMTELWQLWISQYFNKHRDNPTKFLDDFLAKRFHLPHFGFPFDVTFFSNWFLTYPTMDIYSTHFIKYPTVIWHIFIESPILHSPK